MLSINTTPAPPWPVSTGPAVQPVQPVTAPSLVQRSTDDDAPGAPLLPRQRATQEEQAEIELAREEQAREEQAERAERAQEAERQRPPPQQLLSTVWEASAAVVNQALGEEPGGSAASGEGPVTEPPTDQGVAGQDVVSYDERGHGEAAPVELGAIISERV